MFKFHALMRPGSAFLLLAGALTTSHVAASPAVEIRTALWRGVPIRYVMKNGLPVYQGDIILDHLVFGQDAPGHPATTGVAAVASEAPRSLGAIYPFTLWPAVGGVYQIPYVITNGTANLNTAIAEYNTTFRGLIQWVPRTTETNYVDIDQEPTDPGSEGLSYIGLAGIGAQQLTCGTTCAISTLLHEMGHTTGLWHEQSRPDRDTYVTLNVSHIQAAAFINDDIALDNSWIYGPYDYASIMQYSAFSLTADGSQTIQSKPPGIHLSNPNFYTTPDIDGIRRLYSAAPTYTTVDTNPTGLQVVVDGATVTTPRTYTNWALNSAHTLSIPPGLSNSGLQYQEGPPINGLAQELYYQFGQWNDGGAASHTITITPGDGMPGYPPASPAQTVYTANFIQWAPVELSSTSSYPPGTGTVTASPAPTTFAVVKSRALADPFFMVDQSVKLTANPGPGYSFIQWFGNYNCDPVCPSNYANPLNFNYRATQHLQAAFTRSQVTTITTNPPGLTVQVDGNTYVSPVSFSPDPNIDGSKWASGTSHTIGVASPQTVFSPNTTYVWSNWSDGLAESHQITVPGVNSTITANYITQVGLVLSTNSLSASSAANCAGALTANPAGPFNAGASVIFTATPSPGFVFTQWEGALSDSSNPPLHGSTSPSTGPVSHEEFVQADFNTVSSPLTVTSFSPANLSVGAAPFTLTVNGTGFTPTGDVFVNYVNRSVTYISPTQLQVPIFAADAADPGAIKILVENFNDPACWVAATAQLPVDPLQTPAQVLLQIGAEHTGDFTLGQKGATYSVTVSNITSAIPTRGTVTVVETVPSGLTLVSMAGTGWNCSGNSCARSDSLNGGASYPAITVTVDVASNAPVEVTNQVRISGGGSAADTNSDLTTIIGPKHPRAR
jgi:hypothetical protein